MSIRKWYQISCNNCGSAEHFPVGWPIKQQARDQGWVFYKGNHYCNNGCRKQHNQ